MVTLITNGSLQRVPMNIIVYEEIVDFLNR